MATALSISIQNDHDEIFWKLLRAGADVNSFYHDFYYHNSVGSPLYEALCQRKKNLVYAILERDITISITAGSSIATAATKWGDRCVLEDLLSMGVGDLMIEPPQAAVEAGDLDLVTFLVMEHGVPLNNPPDRTGLLLATAVRNKNMTMLKHLLTLGADPACSIAFSHALRLNKEFSAVLLSAFQARYPQGKKCFGIEALHYAIISKNTTLLDELLQAKIDVNTFIRDHDMNGYVASVEDIDININMSALAVAIGEYDDRSLYIMDKLIAAGGNPNSIAMISVEGSSYTVWPQYTCLLLAIQTKSLTLVEFLINAGADIHRAARLGLKRTPLQCACEVGSKDIVELLIGKGASVNEEPAVSGGGTSLQLSAIGGYIGIAYRLLQEGADVHASPSETNGRTALEGAAEHGRLDMVRFIWDAGDAKRFSQEECSRAMKLAEENGHIACCNGLRNVVSSQQYLMPGPDEGMNLLSVRR